MRIWISALCRSREDEEELEEVDVILKDPMEEWKAHTAKTLEYLSKIDFQ